MAAPLEEGQECLADLVGPHRARQSRWALPWIALVAAGAARRARHRRRSLADPCPAQTHYDWMGESVSEAVTIPSLMQPTGSPPTTARSCAPADDAAFPGPRPVVLLQHGLGGNQCAQWWTRPGPRRPRLRRDGLDRAAGHRREQRLLATRSTRCAPRSPSSAPRPTRTPPAATPTASRSRATRSARSSPASSSRTRDPGVRAIVALDTLRRWVNGDPGGAVFECTAARALEITPRVPALGFAKDEPCDAHPTTRPPTSSSRASSTGASAGCRRWSW